MIKVKKNEYKQRYKIYRNLNCWKIGNNKKRLIMPVVILGNSLDYNQTKTAAIYVGRLLFSYKINLFFQDFCYFFTNFGR